MAGITHPMEKTSIKVRHLACARDGFLVFDGVSFEAEPGEVVLLRGPNGVGKSTCLAAVCGAIRPCQGVIDIDCDDPERDSRELFHVVNHLPGMKSTLSVRENLQFWADLYGGKNDVSAAIEAAELSLASDCQAAVLSAGQIQRLALARLLVADRAIWILDEPTSALDTQGETWVGSLIARHARRGGIVIAATHLGIPHLPAGKTKTVTLGEMTQ